MFSRMWNTITSGLNKIIANKVNNNYTADNNRNYIQVPVVKPVIVEDPDIIVIRVDSNDEGTWGILLIDDFICHTIELPWRDNIPFISCVPEGIYKAKLDINTLIGDRHVIRILDGQISGRTHILIHVANYAGDKSMGYKSDVEGCIGVGLEYRISPQSRIALSKKAIDIILNKIKNKDNLTIKITNIQTMISGGDVKCQEI